MPAEASGQVFLHTVQCFPAPFRVVNLLGCGDLLLGLPAHASWQSSPSEGTGVLWFSLITWSNFCSKLLRTFKPGVKPRLSHWRPVRHQSGYWLRLPSAFLLHPLLVLSLVFEHAWCQNSVLVAPLSGMLCWSRFPVSLPSHLCWNATAPASFQGLLWPAYIPVSLDLAFRGSFLCLVLIQILLPCLSFMIIC